MDSFFIITNTAKDPDFAITKRLMAYIQDHGKKCGYIPCLNDNPSNDYKYVDPEAIPEDVQGIIVMGGDGTLLQVARDTLYRRIPIIGINLGTLGYMAEIGTESMFAAMDALMADQYRIERRMMLKGTLYRDGKPVLSDVALNDIFINKKTHNKMINVKIRVGGTLLNSYFADGVIVASPTGSTGYSLSAGGPIVSPQASLFVITPLAPHSMINRSVILPSDEKIALELGKNKYGFVSEAVLLFDGNVIMEIESGDYVEITRSDINVKMMKIYHSSFMEILARKMS